MSTPIAALAIVLAITIRARSSASGGRSVTFVLARNLASSPAMLILRSPIAEYMRRSLVASPFVVNAAVVWQCSGRGLTALSDFDRISGRWLRVLPTSLEEFVTAL